MLEVSTRSPTPDEQRYIDQQGKLDFDTLFAFLGNGVFPSFALGFIGGWLCGFISPDIAMWGRYVGCIVGFIFSIYATTDLWAMQRKWRRLSDADRADSVIEVLTIETNQVVELICHGSHQPCLVFDLGDNQLLYLHGQWIWDTSTYAPFAGDGNEDYFNLLEPPNSFPADTFLVSRLPNSGHVFGIHVTGEFLEPAPPIDALTRDLDFNHCEIIPGMFDDIPNVLQTEHKRRRGT